MPSPTINAIQPNVPGQLVALGRLAPLTIDNTAGGVALTFPSGVNSGQVRYAEILVETAQIRFTVDGTAPTTAVGRTANPGDTIKLATSDFTKFKAIRTGSTSASLQGDYWG
jgi:hypothetical protein